MYDPIFKMAPIPIEFFFRFFEAKPSVNSQIYEFEDATFGTTGQKRRKTEAAKLLKVWVCGKKRSRKITKSMGLRQRLR